MQCFDYFNPVQLLFGPGAFNRLGECVRPGESCAMLVTGAGAARRLGYLDRAVAMLRAQDMQVVVFDRVPPNPTDAIADEGGRLAAERGCDLVVGLGGGSAMDAAKAIAVAATHRFPIREFLVPDEHGNKRRPTDATLPIVCVTTTAGTSSELTPYAVITTTDATQKSAIADPRCYPRASICDPELTYAVPAEVTAATGIDVLCHAVEGYISTVANPITDRAAEEAIRLVGAYLPRLVQDLSDHEARARMSLANVFAGFPLANNGASVIHGLEHPVSAHYPNVAHGDGLATMLVAYARVCYEAAPERFARVSALLGGTETAEAAGDTFADLLARVGLTRRLSDLGVDGDLLETFARDALRYMGGAVEKTPGCPDEACLMRILRASH